MTRSNFKYGIFLISACIVVLSVWASSYLSAVDMERKYGSGTGVRLLNPVGREELQGAVDTEKSREDSGLLQLTAWNRKTGETVTNRGLDRSADITLDLVWGNMQAAEPMELLAGNYVVMQDDVGCVIDGETAWKLFGTDQVVGNELYYNNRVYQIRGVVKTSSQVILLQDQNPDAEYDNLELTFKNQNAGTLLAGNFMLQNSLNVEYVIVDGGFYSSLCISVVKIPLWLLYLYVCVILIKRVIAFFKQRKLYKKTALSIKAAVTLLLIMGAGAGLYALTGNPLSIPERWVPDQWSDFDFWVIKLQELSEEFNRIRFLTPIPNDVALLNSFTGCMKGMLFVYWNVLLFLFMRNKMFFPIFVKESKVV